MWRRRLHILSFILFYGVFFFHFTFIRLLLPLFFFYSAVRCVIIAFIVAIVVVLYSDRRACLWSKNSVIAYNMDETKLFKGMMT